MKILVLNSGSSSQKSSLFDVGPDPPENPPAPEWEGKIEWDQEHAETEVRNSLGAALRSRIKARSRKQAINYLLDTMWSGDTRIISGPADIEAVGHRVVHGGPKYRQPTLITSEVETAIAQMSLFAPLHNRAELGAMDLIHERLGAVPQVAVFDTGFHSQMPEAAAVYPGPYEWMEQGIRRYGFHGINHEYCAGRAAQLLRKELPSLRLVISHLGNGCSLAAVRDGHSIDTTMGFTPVEGLMMGTRSGSVDPGILTYLASTHGVSGQRMDEILNSQSGLLGISGLSNDMRRVEEAMKQGHARAKLAFDIFVHRLQAGIGAMVSVLGGIDALVFTAGIGENSPEVRAAACANFGYLGLAIDPAQNSPGGSDRDISTADSKVRVLVVHAQEDWAIARHCRQLIAS
jgi:acetate kinase